MAAYPSQEREANAADLSTIHPYTLHAFVPLAVDAEGGQSVNQPTLDDVDDVSNRGFAFPLAPFEDWIAHHLPRSVPSQASSSVNSNGLIVRWWLNSVVPGARANRDHLRVSQDE